MNVIEEPEVTLDRLAGDWWIYQLRRGHRYNTDDLLVAWSALCAWDEARVGRSGPLPAPTRVLDLGAGVGSIGLLVLLGLGKAASLLAVEAQNQSVELLEKTIVYNELRGEVEVIASDLRVPSLLDTREPFHIVLANPPYFPLGSASPSPYAQRAAARLETRGNIHDFLMVGARCLRPDGVLCFCHASSDARPLTALQSAGLGLLSRREVCFREGRAPTITLYCCAKGVTDAPREEPPLVIRDASSRFSGEWRAIRRRLRIEE